ncbi:AAA family ATPase [Brachybacterium sp. JHP9]|uniref:AAA family ATPase n=1 Tax=Brachybacterium equifaecis TaxID=2910770 RepID=A0ABT0R1E2_9MICO|nr:AAA family ATPase [Brachybacterium equifaecis]MCL6423711.1 AAA family ATPase [Brachybacterium equifaecis]
MVMFEDQTAAPRKGTDFGAIARELKAELEDQAAYGPLPAAPANPFSSAAEQARGVEQDPWADPIYQAKVSGAAKAEPEPAVSAADDPAGKAEGGIVLTEEFSRALEILHRGDPLFLTGKAGTGKSTLIRRFLGETKRKTVVVAPTGIAALNVEGYTIHRLLSLRPGMTVEDVRNPKYYPRRFASVLKHLDTLIVDEASMVRADLFDCIAEALRRFGPDPARPFGGIQLVLVGDLYQLPPVVGRDDADFTSRYASPFFFDAKAYDAEQFEVVALETVFRQQGDTEFVDLLNDVRDGSVTAGDLAALNIRVDPSFEPEDDELWLTLATTNRAAEDRNDFMLSRTTGEEKTFRAQITGDLDGFERPVPEELRFKVGAQVMLLTNDAEERWANGTIGTIERFGDANDPFEKGSIHVSTPDGSVLVDPHDWEVKRPVPIEGVDEDGAPTTRIEHQVVGVYSQLPMKLAWAITVHKSQGQTLDRVIVDLGGGTFSAGQLYVALSRCTSLEGMVLRRPVTMTDVKVDRRVREFLSVHDTGDAAGMVFLDALTVPTDQGVRILEIAALNEDGACASTLVRPRADVPGGHWGVSSEELLWAPELAEALRGLSPVTEGRIPAGEDITLLLSIIDEQTRAEGTSLRYPLSGLETVCTHAPYGPALGRLEAVRQAVLEDRAQDATAGEPGEGTASARSRMAPIPPRRGGYLLPRGAAFPGGLSGRDAALAAQYIQDRARRIQITPQRAAQIREAEQMLGTQILDTLAGQNHELRRGDSVILPERPTETGRPRSATFAKALAEHAGLKVPKLRLTKAVQVVPDGDPAPEDAERKFVRESAFWTFVRSAGQS